MYNCPITQLMEWAEFGKSYEREYRFEEQYTFKFINTNKIHK